MARPATLAAPRAHAPAGAVTAVRDAHAVRIHDRAWIVEVLVVVNGLLVVGLWLRHGGAGTIGQPGGLSMAIGDVTALVGTYAVLLELLLMSRIEWLERRFGFDHLAVYHRWTGFAAVLLLAAHAVFTTVGYARSGALSLPVEVSDFIRHYPDVLMAIVGFALFVAVGVTSARAARRRLARESWYALHLYAYLAVALSFAHQLAVGTDLSTDAVARAWWVAMYVVVFGSIAMWRVARPVAFNIRHRLVVDSVRHEADGVVSVYITGRDLDLIAAEAGQFFLWRFLTRKGWAKAHPFSLSAAPNGRFLRITVKSLGDDTAQLQRLRPGVRVFAEGPYGTFTERLRTRRRVALIAGGIGITPLRALLESMPGAPGDITLLYRAQTEGDVAFRKELRTLAERRGVEIRTLIGREIGNDRTDQLGVPQMRKLVPDIAERDVYLCGPPPMIEALRRRLASLQVPATRIHYERFEY
jgi:predicted ferric reductase